MNRKLAPFFSYYGSKRRLARYYPEPEYMRIIEPFAGSAGYATQYPERRVILYDLDPVVCGVWDYLIRSKASEINALPVDFDSTDELNVCQEAKWFIGFWIAKARSYPAKNVSAWGKKYKGKHKGIWEEDCRSRIAAQVDLINHWKVYNQSCFDIPNQPATWFVDPPYQCNPGDKYRVRFNEYDRLAGWCKERDGQTIVCEQYGSDWLPFRPFRESLTASGNYREYSSEVIWTNNN